jgi:SAM-dependent methyltransferase
MKRLKNTRESILKSSRSYYSRRAYYWNLIDEERPERYKRELDFIEHAFSNNATRPIAKVLDIACGNGRHLLGLAKHGYECTGLDYTPENIQIARKNAKREGVSIKLLQGDSTQLNYEDEFDAILAVNVLHLLPNDNDVLKCLCLIHRALRSGGLLVCNIGNPFYEGERWYSLKKIFEGLIVEEAQTSDMHVMEIGRLVDYDPMYGVAWWQETSIIEAPDGTHVFRGQEHRRLFTYWDILHYLQVAGFEEIKCYIDWLINTPKKPKAVRLVFVSRK